MEEGLAVGGATTRTPPDDTAPARSPAVGVSASGWANSTGTRGSGEYRGAARRSSWSLADSAVARPAGTKGSTGRLFTRSPTA